MIKKITVLLSSAYESVTALQTLLEESERIESVVAQAHFYKDKILPTMATLRKYADELEMLVSADYWPFPTYGELLFGISE